MKYSNSEESLLFKHLPNFTLGLLLFCSLILTSANLHSQEWMEKEGLDKNNLFEIEKAFHDHWKDKERSSGDGYKPFMRWIEQMKYNIDKEGNIMSNIGYDTYSKLIQRSSNSSTATKSMWNPIGPINSPRIGIGRINDIASHPSDPNRFYAAAPSGGVWISDDACATWYTTTDKLAQIGITEIDIHPNDPNIIIASTGDDEGQSTRSIGLIKSVDKGLSWKLLPITSTVCDTFLSPVDPSEIIIECEDLNLNFYQIYGLYWHSSNSNIMIAATSSGVLRSVDQGLTWSLIQNHHFRDIKAHPTNPDIIYGYSHLSKNCFVTQDAGETWTTVILPDNAGIYRGALAVSQQEPNTVYLAAANGSEHKLYKSIDQGYTYSMVPPFQFFFGNQSYYNWAFVADPNNVNNIFIGGVTLANSTDGGQTLSNFRCDEECIHVDFHYLGFHHGSLYAGSDGGVYRKTGSDNWEELTQGLQITQYYRCSTAESDSLTVMGGSQDNGTHKYDYKWRKTFGGDGMDNGIDPNNENQIYYSTQNGEFFKSTDGGLTQQSMIGSSTTGTSGVWVTPFSIDPNSPNVLYTGYRKLWKSVDYGDSWSATSSSPLIGSSLINYFDIAPSNSNVIYAYSGGLLHKSVNAGVNWSQPTNPPIFISRIKVDPNDENRLWVCGSQDILESVDGGQTWFSIKLNIPDGININTIAYDKNTNDHLYIGTTFGVMFKDDTMNEWVQFDNLLPNVIVSELVITESYHKIRAATYGRGMWESYTVGHYACYDSINIQHTIDEGIYHASRNISTDGLKITSNESQLKAGVDIDLLPNFEVKAMTTFSALIEECPEVKQVYNLPLAIGNYCETAIPIINIPGQYQVDLSNRESHWFVIDSDIRYKVDILSCGEGVNTSMKIWAGNNCQIYLNENISDYCSTNNNSDVLAAGIDNYILLDYQTYFLEWSAENLSEISTCITIENSNDDAEEFTSSGNMYLTSSDLEMAHDNEEQLVGMIFKNVDVPQGANITSAYIQFTTDEESNEPTSLTIKGEATDSANSFTASQGNISNRQTTLASVDWAPNPWSIEGENGPNQSTPDISSVISEIVNRAGYVPLNNIGIVISGIGKRIAESYDGSTILTPQLCITYESASQSPVIFDFEILITDSVGYYCDYATPVELGNNGGELLQDGATYGGSAKWYSYVASDNGTIDITSCNIVEFTNLIVWEGTCENKTILQQDDNFCTDFGPIRNSAALYGVPVTANTQYLIEWDNQDGGNFTSFEFVEHF